MYTSAVEEEEFCLAEASERVAQPEGVGGLEVGEGEGALLEVGLGFEEVSAEDAGEDSRGEGWGEKLPCPAGVGGKFDEEIADGSFGEFAALVEEEDLIESVGAGSGELVVIEMAVGGFVAEEGVGGVCTVGAQGYGEVLRGRRGLSGLAGSIVPTRPKRRVRMGHP